MLALRASKSPRESSEVTILQYRIDVYDEPNGWFDSWKSTYAEAKQREAEIKAMPTRADAVVFIREHTVPTEPKALAKWLTTNAR